MSELQIIILVITGLGFGYHMYKVGVRSGASVCIEELHKQKIICFDHRGDIKPNPFWEEIQKSKK